MVELTVSDSQGSGTVRLTPTSICWGERKLYCAPSMAEVPQLRLAWHPGDAAQNKPQGYYLWLGDMLIGQGLPAAEPAGQGIRLEAAGKLRLFATISLRHTTGSYAPE